MTENAAADRRLGKLETEFAIVKNDVLAISQSLSDFRREWSDKADEDRAAHRAARLTPGQVVGMLAGMAAFITALLTGNMFLIDSRIQSANLGTQSQLAQVGLTVRGQGDAVTATQTAIQQIQRDNAGDRVKLGLVEQQAGANTRFIDQAQSFDAHLARADERLKSLEQFARDLAARRPP